MQNLGHRSLIALAYTIEQARKAYHNALAHNNKDIEITDWLVYFAEAINHAQDNTIMRVDFYMAKAKLYEQLRGKLNEHQDKVIARMFREGVDGFKGGLSAENYISITKPRTLPRQGTCKTSSRWARSRKRACFDIRAII